MLSGQAAFSEHAQRRTPEKRLQDGYRQAYALDTDRILHSRAYTRYIDKTQVFYLIKNDHITHRVLHVQLVSKIARTIGRFLGLNEDLIEAIALGHDIGHTPFGHDGERFLSEKCHQAGIGFFLHNVQSIQFLDRVERKGRGWNLCLQTLDGILCHDGEIHPSGSGDFVDLVRQYDTCQCDLGTIDHAGRNRSPGNLVTEQLDRRLIFRRHIKRRRVVARDSVVASRGRVARRVELDDRRVGRKCVDCVVDAQRIRDADLVVTQNTGDF